MSICQLCQHDHSKVRASLREEILCCEGCSGDYCKACLKVMWKEAYPDEEVPEFEDAQSYMQHCEVSGCDLCPACFEEVETKANV